MNTPGSSKSDDGAPGRPPRTPLASERYNTSQPPLCTRLEMLQSTPRLQLKAAPKIYRSNDRRSYGGKSVMNSPLPQMVNSSQTSVGLSPIYDPKSNILYVKQVFKEEDLLGQGSFGKVFRMKSLEDDRVYAVKCLQEPYRNASVRKERLKEVTMHHKIPKHDNLVEFICAWEERDLLYIQMELCEMSLEAQLHAFSRLPEWRVWDVLLDLAKAVDYLDKLNIIHTDIKPANVLVSFEGVCKLCDFGMMLDFNTDKAEEDRHEGDSKYLAREVLNSGVTKMSVIFSLGLSIFQIATDVWLDSNGERWNDIRDLNISPKFTEHLTPELVNFIYQMMAPVPEERLTAAQILDDPFLRQHDAVGRDWNMKLYPMFRQMSKKPQAA